MWSKFEIKEDEADKNLSIFSSNLTKWNFQFQSLRDYLYNIKSIIKLLKIKNIDVMRYNGNNKMPVTLLKRIRERIYL